MVWGGISGCARARSFPLGRARAYLPEGRNTLNPKLRRMASIEPIRLKAKPPVCRPLSGPAFEPWSQTPSVGEKQLPLV